MTRVILLFVFLIVTASAEISLADEECSEEFPTISKEIYDLVVHGSRTGVTLSDVEPSNLDFESESLSDCMGEADMRIKEKDERQIAYLACWKRHPPQPECDELE